MQIPSYVKHTERRKWLARGLRAFPLTWRAILQRSVCMLKFYCIFLLIEILYRGHGDITMGKSSKKLGSNLHAIPLTIDSL